MSLAHEFPARRSDGDRSSQQSASNRVPPHNLEAEEALLGAMLLSRDAINDAEAVLTSEHFYRPAHAVIFDAICTLFAEGHPPDAVTVADYLERENLLEEVGGNATLVRLQTGTPAVTSTSRYAHIVHELAKLRELVRCGGEISELGYTGTNNVDGAIDEAETLVFNVAQDRLADSTKSLKDLLDPTLGHIEYIYDHGDKVTGTPTGFTDLDQVTGGLQKGTLVVVGARPAMGKTSFALAMASNAAIRKNKPVLLFSLEMSQMEITQRILCAHSRVDSARIRSGKLSEDDWDRLNRSIGPLASAPLWIDDNPAVTIMEIRAKARRLKSREGGLSMVLVDYLQLMVGRSRAENRQVEVSEISRGLKVLARELECPVVALSQLSRNLEARTDKRPILSDLRESGAIEQDADLVMFLYRDEMYNPESPDRGLAEVNIAKHRTGPTARTRLVYFPNETRFADEARV